MRSVKNLGIFLSVYAFGQEPQFAKSNEFYKLAMHNYEKKTLTLVNKYGKGI